MGIGTLGLLGTLAVSAAEARPKAEDLRQSWSDPGAVRRVHVQSTVAMPQLLRIELPDGRGVRVTVFDIEYVARCSLEEARPASFSLRCPLEAVRLSAQPIAEEADRQQILQGILDNYTWRLDDAWLQVEIGQDGRLRHFDIEDVRERMLGDRNETELLRRLFRQGFAGLELLVPPRAQGKEWGSANPRVMEHLAWDGTHGHVQLDNRIVDSGDGWVRVESGGEGTIKPGPSRFMGLQMQSDTVFDTELGAVVEARWSGFSQPLPSYLFAWNEMTRPYLFWGQARVAPLDAPVLLDAGGPLGNVVIPPDLQQRMADEEAERRSQRMASVATAGVLTPPGRTPTRSPAFGWFRVGAAGGIAGALSSPVDVDVGAGARLPADVWLGAGGRLKVPLEPENTQGTWIHHDHDAFVSVGWSPLYRVSPRIGMLAGATTRTWRGDYEGWSVAPMGGVEFGVRSKIGHGVWLEGWIRSTAEAGAWERTGWNGYGGGQALLTHRAGLSLLLGPGPNRPQATP